MMRLSKFCVAGLLSLGMTVHAATFSFTNDPFEGTDALTTVGRQVVGNPGTPIAFNIANDVLTFDRDVFGVDSVSFANGLVGSLPETGINFVVVQDTGTPFGAGAAADLIAERFTDPGPGFFVYFNTNLGVARFVYSTDLNSPDADLAVLARLTTIDVARGGLSLFPTITAGNFAPVPEPSSVVLTSAGVVATWVWALRRRRTQG